MKKKIFFMLLSATFFGNYQLMSQWLVGGNPLAANGRLGTNANSNHAVIFITHGIDRGAISKDGLWGIGTKAPTQKLHVEGNTVIMGNLGVGMTTPAYPVDISNATYDRGINVLNSYSDNVDFTGVYSSSKSGVDGYGKGIISIGGFIGTESYGYGGTSGNPAYGVIAAATGTDGTRYGVHTTGSGGETNYGIYAYGAGGTTNYGIYAAASGDPGSINYAGYFSGDVFCSGLYLPFASNMRTAQTPLQNPLEQLMKLKPVNYQFKTTDFPEMQLPGGKQMGLIADEVKQIFPELVKEQVQPAKYGQDKREMVHPEVKFDGVNYIGFIPVLIASVQEQQKMIQELSMRNEDLQRQIKGLKSMIADKSQANISSGSSTKGELTDASLEQNTPNPFINTTTINYTLPKTFTTAQILISDKNGKVLKQVNVSGPGKGTLNVNAATLSPGAYDYSLIVDGKVISSKHMILTK